jgi:hypothetical protein
MVSPLSVVLFCDMVVVCVYEFLIELSMAFVKTYQDSFVFSFLLINAGTDERFD